MPQIRKTGKYISNKTDMNKIKKLNDKISNYKSELNYYDDKYNFEPSVNGYLYICEDSKVKNGVRIICYKIGFALDMKKRLTQYKTGNFKHKLIAYIPLQIDRKQIEQCIKIRLKPHLTKLITDTICYLSLTELKKEIIDCINFTNHHICHCVKCSKIYKLNSIDKHKCNLQTVYNIIDYKPLKKSSKKTPGDLEIINFDSIDLADIMKDYVIESNPIPNQLYVKLDSTNLYVSENTYEIKHFLSRQNELKNIFVELGAKSIKYHIKRIKSNNTDTNANVGVENNAIGLGQEFNITNNKSSLTQEHCVLTFDYNEKISNVNYETFSNINNFYFLPKEYEWQNIIIRRLEHSQLTDKYVLKNNFNIKMSTSAKSNLKFAKIGFGHGTEDLDLIEIEYDIEYYPLVKTKSKSDPNDIPVAPINPNVSIIQTNQDIHQV
jgi:hypothetical protein